METPLTDHLTCADFEHVYEPAEDSFLLLDALESDLENLDNLKPLVCVEIGSGSGVIITALAKRLKLTFCMATDINLRACTATRSTALKNSSPLADVINCNLVDVLQSNLVDVLIFNPPYVETSDQELMQSNSSLPKTTERNLVRTWAGGQYGRRVIDEILQNLVNILSPTGVLYLLLLHANKPDDIANELRQTGFEVIKLLERHIPGERLCVLKATRC